MEEHVLDSVITTGRIEKEFTVLNMKVRLKTLSSKEFWDVLKETSGYDGLTQFVGVKIKTLSRSIVSIDGRKVEYIPSDEHDTVTPQKCIQQNEKIIGKWQTKVVDLFFAKYEELGEEQQSFLLQSQISSKEHGAKTSGKSPE